MGKKRKAKKKKKKSEKEKRIKPAVCVFIDADGATIRFERYGAELFFYVDSELCQRKVEILKIQRSRGFIIIRGEKVKTDQPIISFTKSIVEVNLEDLDKVLLEIDKVRYWNGPLCVNASAKAAGEDGQQYTLSRYDAQQGVWVCLSEGRTQFRMTPESIDLQVGILPHNCRLRQDTRFCKYTDSKERGVGVSAAIDLRQNQVVLKDQPLLNIRLSLEQKPIESRTILCNFIHTLFSKHPKVLSFLLENISDSGPEIVNSYLETARTFRESLASRLPIYQDEKYEHTFARILSIIYGNGIVTICNNMELATIFPLISFFNHSSDPNCTLQIGSNQLGHYAAVRTLRPIKEGEPITILPRPKQF